MWIQAKNYKGFYSIFFSSEGGDSGKKYANSAFISYYSQIFFTLFTPITKREQNWVKEKTQSKNSNLVK